METNMPCELCGLLEELCEDFYQILPQGFPSANDPRNYIKLSRYKLSLQILQFKTCKNKHINIYNT